VLARLAGLLFDPADELIRIALRLFDVRVGEFRELPLDLRLQLRELLLKLLFRNLIEAHAHLLSVPGNACPVSGPANVEAARLFPLSAELQRLLTSPPK
jgi:hypothetical protein